MKRLFLLAGVLLVGSTLISAQSQGGQTAGQQPSAPIPPMQAPEQAPAAPAAKSQSGAPSDEKRGEKKSDVPEIGAGLGSCKVEFHITSLAGKGIYNAKVSTVIKYGLFNAK